MNKAYQEGVRARNKGLSMNDCPYKSKDDELLNRAWKSGWADQDQILMTERKEN